MSEGYSNRVLIIGAEDSELSSLEALLQKNGCDTQLHTYGESTVKAVSEWQPATILIEATSKFLKEKRFWHTVENIRKDSFAYTVFILDDIREKSISKKIEKRIKDNCDDFILKPINNDELMMRLKTRVEWNKMSKEVLDDKKRLESIMGITNAVSSSLEMAGIFDIIVKKVAEAVGALDCSVVSINQKMERGVVLESFKKLHKKNLEIDLNRYPEVQKVLENKKPLAINDIANHPLMKDIKDEVRHLTDISILVIPIVFDDDELGTMFLRAKKVGGGFTEKENDLCKLVADASFFAIKNARHFEKMNEEKEKLERIAITDQLTSLFNHNYFYERLEEEFSKADRYGVNLSLIMMDIDDFKLVNDTYGHRVGDKVLRKAAKVLRDSVRKADIVARYGGEEFAIILPYTRLAGAMDEAERMRKLIEGLEFGLSDSKKVTMSLGVATYSRNTVRSTAELVNLADKALYQAKGEGKNCVRTLCETGSLKASN
ncbi:MAG: diguanylate cyclase [Thermodesulfobacteriota bacterium]